LHKLLAQQAALLLLVLFLQAVLLALLAVALVALELGHLV
jgi:hypothetical protein